MEQIASWNQVLMASLTNAVSLVSVSVPKLIAFLIVLIIGWLIASALASGIAMLLRKLKFNGLADSAGVSGVIAYSGLHQDASGVIALVVKWFIRLIALIVAFDALGLPVVSEIFQKLLLWLPNLVIALVIVVIGGWAANAIAALVRAAATTASSANPNLVVSIARTAIWVFTAIVAINQLGIATELVQMLFAAIVGALALGLGLAVGLGGKDLAGELLRKWYSNTQAPKE
jgi:small-conductance mechanosensitive channel